MNSRWRTTKLNKVTSDQFNLYIPTSQIKNFPQGIHNLYSKFHLLYLGPRFGWGGTPINGQNWSLRYLYESPLLPRWQPGRGTSWSSGSPSQLIVFAVTVVAPCEESLYQSSVHLRTNRLQVKTVCFSMEVILWSHTSQNINNIHVVCTDMD